MSAERPETIGALIEWCAKRLETGGVYCGHGTADLIDEAAVLVYFVTGHEHSEDPHAVYRCRVKDAEFIELGKLLARRIGERLPAPYLTGEAWFAGLRFAADPRALIPRSPLGGMIRERFRPWLGRGPVRRIADIGTGGGCIAVACALAFPEAVVVGTDISAAALELAAENLRLHGVTDRVQLVRTNLAEGLGGPFDLIVSNPPYVPDSESSALPPEYHHEPRLALFSGPDGLDSPGRILQDAPRCLGPRGTLVLEVGEGRKRLERAFPGVPFIWPETVDGGDGIAVIGARGLRQGLN